MCTVFFGHKKWKCSVDTATLNFAPAQLRIMPLDSFHRGSSQARLGHASQPVHCMLYSTFSFLVTAAIGSAFFCVALLSFNTEAGVGQQFISVGLLPLCFSVLQLCDFQLQLKVLKTTCVSDLPRVNWRLKHSALCDMWESKHCQGLQTSHLSDQQCRVSWRTQQFVHHDNHKLCITHSRYCQLKYHDKMFCVLQRSNNWGVQRLHNQYLYKLCTQLKLMGRVCAWLKELTKAYRICAQNILFSSIILELISAGFSLQQHNLFMPQFSTSIFCVSYSQCFTAGEITDRGAHLSFEF